MKQTFNEAFNENQAMLIIKPYGTEINGFYSCISVDRETLPDGWYAYDIRHDDNGLGIFVELCHNYVIVNNDGTFFTQTKISELTEPGSSVEFEIDKEEWNMLSETEDCPVQSGDLWGYSFL